MWLLDCLPGDNPTRTEKVAGRRRPAPICCPCQTGTDRASAGLMCALRGCRSAIQDPDAGFVLCQGGLAMKALLVTVVSFAAFNCLVLGAAQAQQPNRMQACAAEWKTMKAANQTAGKKYRD